MFLVKKEQNNYYSIPAKELNLDSVKVLGSKLAQQVLKELAKKVSYPSELAKELKVHEQKIYYHIRNLEKAGIIKVVKEEEKKGATAKYYGLTEPSFFIKFEELKQTNKLQLRIQKQEFLNPFIKDGKLDALIIVGSPDPHGPEKARSRDGYYGIDFALFLGTFLNYIPHFNVKLDTEVREEDLKNNLIIIGGPVVNKITYRINKKLPIFFDESNGWAITSTISRSTYPSDESGLVVKAKNPFIKNKNVLVIGGKRFAGTRAGIIAFLQNFKKVTSGNIHNPNIPAKVVEGIDLDSDGIIDAVEFRE